MNAPSIHWFRLDLRLADNPALRAAIERGGPVVPVFIWSPEEEAPWPPGEASRWWLHQSLRALETQLRAAGSRLVIRRGPAFETLWALLKEAGLVHIGTTKQGTLLTQKGGEFLDYLTASQMASTPAGEQ